MPWTHVLCPDGQKKSFEECLVCLHECFDLEIREAMFERERNWQAIEHTGERISVTALLGCLRSTYLERVTDYAAHPESQWWSLRGELIHRLVERPDMDNPYLRRSELRLRAKVNGYEVSGQWEGRGNSAPCYSYGLGCMLKSGPHDVAQFPSLNCSPVLT